MKRNVHQLSLLFPYLQGVGGDSGCAGMVNVVLSIYGRDDVCSDDYGACDGDYSDCVGDYGGCDGEYIIHAVPSCH